MPDTGTPSIGPTPGAYNGGGKKGAIRVVNSIKDADHKFKWSPGGIPTNGLPQDSTKEGINPGNVSVNFSKPPKHSKPASITVKVVKDQLHTVTVSWA